MFTQNESGLDRALRAIIGIALVVAMFYLTGAWVWAAGIVAAVLLVTAAVGFCPLYALLRISTKSPRHAA
jgi:Flp pilus assembly protein TadB